MHFNISSVSICALNGNNFWDIQGFSRDNTKTIFRTVIHQGKLSDLVSDNSFFHEGNALVVVSQNEAYNIDLTFYDSEDAWDSMNNGTYCNADTLNYFDKGAYVGLPAVVFCTWKGMLTTDI